MKTETKKINWVAKLLFGKWCLMPGYSGHLEFYKEQAKFSQRREDEFVEREIERLAQEQYNSYLQEKQKWDAFSETLKSPEAKSLCFPVVCQRTYPRCYYVYDTDTAKYKTGGININEKIQERYNQLLSPQ